jgi:hypothetical protein
MNSVLHLKLDTDEMTYIIAFHFTQDGNRVIDSFMVEDGVLVQFENEGLSFY